MRPGRALLSIALPLVLAACDRPAERPERAPAQAGRQAGAGESVCYRSASSVLLGPLTAGGQQGEGPGWIRIDGGLGADSGAAGLRDANSKTMAGQWRRVTGDSVAVTAFDDFLRVELRLVVSDTMASGIGSSRSDAALERDSAGTMQELRRSWVLAAPAAPCDSMPA